MPLRVPPGVFDVGETARGLADSAGALGPSPAVLELVASAGRLGRLGDSLPAFRLPPAVVKGVAELEAFAARAAKSMPAVALPGGLTPAMAALGPPSGLATALQSVSLPGGLSVSGLLEGLRLPPGMFDASPFTALFNSPLFDNALLEQWRKDGEAFDRVLLALGWPPPGLLPVTLARDVARAFEAGEITQADVEALFVEFYTRKRLDEMLAAWRRGGHAPHRLPILEAAVEAHTQGRYVLSVPAMIPQIEGVVADLFGHLGRMKGRDLKGYVAAVFTRPDGFDAAGARFLLQTLWGDQFAWGEPVPQLNRHAILHGADTSYATAANSLRLILQFDQLQDAIVYVASRRGRLFHVAGCPGLRRGAGRRLFRDRAATAAVGLAPCGRCLARPSASG